MTINFDRLREKLDVTDYNRFREHWVAYAAAVLSDPNVFEVATAASAADGLLDEELRRFDPELAEFVNDEGDEAVASSSSNTVAP